MTIHRCKEFGQPAPTRHAYWTCPECQSVYQARRPEWWSLRFRWVRTSWLNETSKYDSWAGREWTKWREGKTWFSDAEGDLCPRCFHIQGLGGAEYMAGAHSELEARRRWAHNAEVKRLKFDALGGCQCGRNETGHDTVTVAELRKHFPNEGAMSS